MEKNLLYYKQLGNQIYSSSKASFDLTEYLLILYYNHNRLQKIAENLKKGTGMLRNRSFGPPYGVGITHITVAISDKYIVTGLPNEIINGWNRLTLESEKVMFDLTKGRELN